MGRVAQGLTYNPTPLIAVALYLSPCCANRAAPQPLERRTMAKR